MVKPLYVLHAHASRRNVGDDAIVMATYALAAEAIPDREVRFLDVARHPHSNPGEPVADFLPLYRYHLPRYWGRVLSCLRRADAVLIGGGELMSGGIEFLGLGLLGWAAGLPVVYAGLGVDLGRASWLNRAYSSFVARRAHFFVTRDDEAARELRDLGVSADRIQVAPDLVMALPVPEFSPPTRRPGDPVRIGVSLRPQQQADYPLGEPELTKLAQLLDSLVETRNATIVLLPFLDPDASFDPLTSRFGTDRDVLQRLAELMRHRDRTTLYTGSLHPLALLEVLSGLDGLIAMRLHAAILGLKAGLLPLAIEYAPKTRRTLTRLGFGHRVVGFAELSTPGMADRVLANRVDPATIESLSKEARRNLAILGDAMKGARRRSSALRLFLAAPALLVHAAIALYAALPPIRPAWARRRSAPPPASG